MGTVLITGASSGIGRALAVAYGARGAKVAIAARRVSELESCAEEIRAKGGSALVLPLDVTNPDEIRETLHRADTDLGGLDRIIANAGVGTQGNLARAEWRSVSSVIDVNITGAFATLFFGMQIFVARKAGHLVGISSLAGKRGLPRSMAYSASKAALSTFLETMRMDVAKFGVRVTDVKPGFVATPMVDESGKVPFIWPVEKASQYIVERLEDAPRVVEFPFPLTWITGLSRVLPAPLFERVVRALV